MKQINKIEESEKFDEDRDNYSYEEKAFNMTVSQMLERCGKPS